jgi:hypothetical protein
VAKKKKKRRAAAERDQGRYVCPTCGEEIVIPIDVTAGAEQTYGEDCPVCCHPNVIHVEMEEGWDAPRVWAEAE